MALEHPTDGDTWLEVGVANAGLASAVKGLTWSFCWAIARQAIGSNPSAEQVADWWNDSHRTTYRNQAAFRKSFPSLDGPGPMFESPDALAFLDRAFRGLARADVERNWRTRFIEEGVVRLGLFPAGKTSTERRKPNR